MIKHAQVVPQVPMSQRLADFPWDQIAPFRDRASAHPEGLVDLSMGTPVDSTPEVIRHALAQHADAPGYPKTLGQPDLREAAINWMARRLSVVGLNPHGVLPLMGTKELLAWLPTLLEVPHSGAVVVPALAYPSYVAAANIASTNIVFADDPSTIDANEQVDVCFINFPNNPTGRVASTEELRHFVTWARAHDVVLVSDECYIEFAWSSPAVSVLHPEVCDGSFENLLAVHSLSKRSNMAGYRAGFFTGDPRLVTGLLEIRKHLGVAVPTPVQAAMTAALQDDDHVDAQRCIYKRRLEVLTRALRDAGWDVPECQGGLYLWIDREGFSSWDTVSLLSGLGILATPGDFYGPNGRGHVRVSLTASDERIDSAARRLHQLG